MRSLGCVDPAPQPISKPDQLIWREAPLGMYTLWVEARMHPSEPVAFETTVMIRTKFNSHVFTHRCAHIASEQKLVFEIDANSGR
jgi:hypothetical protein